MKKIYLLSELFYPNKTSTAYIMTEIAKYLASKYEVTAICSDIVYDANFAKDQELDNHQFKIVRTKSPNVNKNKTSSRIWGSIYTAVAFGRKVVKLVTKDDTILAVTNPFLLVLTLALIRRFKRFNYVLLVHDVFPENAVPAGMTNPNGILYKISKIVYDWAYGKADRLVVLGRDMQQLVEQKIATLHKAVVVENWYDKELEIYKAVDRNVYFQRDVTDKIVIGFAGNIGRVQHLPEFVQIFKEIDNEKLILAIVGDGANKEQILQIIANNNMSNVIYVGARPREEQSTFLHCFDIGLITLSPGMYGLGVPSKTYNLLALGKPILYVGDKLSETDLLLEENNIGWSFSWEQKEDLRKCLTLLTDVDQEQMKRARQLAESQYRADVILSKLDKVLSNEH